MPKKTIYYFKFIHFTLIFYSITPIATNYSGLRIYDENPLDFAYGLENAHIQLGKWLKKYAYPETVIALQDVGAIPYYSGLKTIDIHPEGLTNRHTIEFGFDWNHIFTLEIDLYIIVLGSNNPTNLTDFALKLLIPSCLYRIPRTFRDV